jgi:hypothetical protein
MLVSPPLVTVPAIDFFQEELAPASLDAVPMDPDEGWVIIVAGK